MKNFVFYSVFLELCYILAAPVLVVLGASLIIIFLPIYLFRFGVKYVAKTLRPDLAEMVSTKSSIYATDAIYTKPKASIVTYFVLDGCMTQESIEVLLSKFFQRRNNLGNKLCYPEGMQYITTWFGFYFWKHEEKYDFRNHYIVHNEDNTEFHEQDLGELVSDWLAQPFPKRLSPWQVRIIQNFRSKENQDKHQSVLLLRTHHAFADGFSIAKFGSNLCDKPIKFMENSGTFSKLGSWQLLSQILLLPVLTPYRCIKLAYESFDLHEWHLKQSSNEVAYALHPKISVLHLKEIKEHYKVSSISVVIMAAFAGTLRRAMQLQGVKVPSLITLGMPFPIPGHPDDKLVNHVGLATIGLPVGIVDPVERLFEVQKICDNLVNDPTPLVLFRMSNLLGGLFGWMARPLCANFLTTVGASTLPGPKVSMTVSGMPVTDIGYFLGSMMGNAGVMFNTLTYMGNLRLTLGFDKELLSTLPNPRLDVIAAGFGKEISALRNYIPTGNKEKVF